MPNPRRVNIEKALKMKMQGQSLATIGRDQGLSKQAINQAIKPLLEQLANPEIVEYYRKNQANIFDGLAARTVGSIVDEDFSKATLQQKVVAVGILTDKSRLVQGQSTSNTSIMLKAIMATGDCAVDNSPGTLDVVDDA